VRRKVDIIVATRNRESIAAKYAIIGMGPRTGWRRKRGRHLEPGEPARVRAGPGQATFGSVYSAAKLEQRAVKTPDMAERRMTPAQITEAQKLARDWKPATQPSPR
jgi:hypothetical protein